MAGRKRKKSEDHPKGVPGWMVTYGDMMTLLLCFFILLFSFSTLDVVKFRDVIIELQGAFGVLSGGPMVLNLGDIPAKQLTENLTASHSSLNQVQESIQEAVEEAELEGSVETEINERGLVIRFTDTVLFDLGKAELKSEAIPVLEAVAAEIREIQNQIAVEGHTDPTPIHTVQFPSNWWLSTGRACTILQWFLEEGGIPPDRMTASGYAYYRPVAPNNTPENRTRNRRVDVIILETEDALAAQSRREALDFLESSESDRIVVTVPEAEVQDETGSSETSEIPETDQETDQETDEPAESNSGENTEPENPEPEPEEKKE